MVRDLALVDNAIHGLQELKKKLKVDPAHIETLEYQLEYFKKKCDQLEADLLAAQKRANDERFRWMMNRNLSYSQAVREAIKLLPDDHPASIFLRKYKEGACRCGLPFSKQTLELHAKYPEQYTKVGKRTFYLCDECYFCGQGEKPCVIKTKRKATKGARDAVTSETTARSLLKVFIDAYQKKDPGLAKRTVKVAQEYLNLGKEE